MRKGERGRREGRETDRQGEREGRRKGRLKEVKKLERERHTLVLYIMIIDTCTIVHGLNGNLAQVLRRMKRSKISETREATPLRQQKLVSMHFI